MANDLNKVFLCGRLTKDAELKYTGNGMAVSNFSIAVGKSFKKGENWEKKTVYFNLAVFGKTAENLSKYLSKGQQVIVEGDLDENEWEKDGVKQKRLVVHVASLNLVGGKKSDGGGIPSSNQNSSANDAFYDQDPADDDVPF